MQNSRRRFNAYRHEVMMRNNLMMQADQNKINKQQIGNNAKIKIK